jgi:transketolase
MRQVEPGATRSNVPLAERAYRIRRNALRMGAVQGQGYIAQALGVADVLAVAYFHAMRYRPHDPHWEERDRFLLSIGHYAIALYAVLIEAGILPEEEIETYGTDDSRLPMSGMSPYTPGMEITGGSLGHGLGIAVGFSDGELGEGSTWEAALSAPHWRLDNLIGIIDVNNQQADGLSSEVTGLEPLVAKWEAFGWHTQRVDGNDIDALVAAFDDARALREPSPRMIICDTKMAKGVPFLEEREMTHFLRVDEGEWDKALDVLDASRQASLNAGRQA